MCRLLPVLGEMGSVDRKVSQETQGSLLEKPPVS